MDGLDMDHGSQRTLQQHSHSMDKVPFPAEWDPRLSVGDEYIDTQHAMLFYLIAQLKDALASDEGRNHLVKILDEVKKYATFHFASEENHMAEMGYPDRHEHTRIHTRMLVELSEHIRDIRIDWRFGRAALEFVESWLKHHVAKEDQKFAQYAKDVRGAR